LKGDVKSIKKNRINGKKNSFELGGDLNDLMRLYSINCSKIYGIQ
jgi:hypothetical protein